MLNRNHYFSVELVGVNDSDKLLDLDAVEDYLIQHAPLKYIKEFRWQGPIIQKIKSLGYSIPEYNIKLNGKLLYKPYEDIFVSDRVKKNEDRIKDIDIVPFYVL